MCHKVRVFKQFHAVMMTSVLNAPKTLHVFNHVPSQQQVDEVVQKYVIGKKMEPTPFIYSEKPQIHVVPVHINPDIMLN